MNPYRIGGPALISFSGGRTSAYMLHEIVRAYGGQLPDDVVVAFANTGREREETLRFVYECGSRWGVKIHWLEWRQTSKPCFEEVGYNSASRAGEPFAELMRRKKTTPNSMRRFCTQELKVRVMQEFAQSLGWERWNSAVGLRYDEGHRVLKALARNDAGERPDVSVMPLSRAKVTKRDVLEFWHRQQFDLGLRAYEGNCDLCFMKSRGALQTIMREQPVLADWWLEQERQWGRFQADYSLAEIKHTVDRQGFLFDEEHDTECGLICAGAA
jgi:3'-phosphoadenosine 5'-phosphosulfate sulfotransferase (PAPS reductase)/FAD synthetase